METSAKLYYSIRSAYSYLGIMRLQQLLPAQPAPIEIQVKPVMPIAVRRPELFKKLNPLAIPHLELDTRRAAQRYGIGFRVWPVPDPIVQNMKTLEIASEQPYIYRLTRLMQCAVEMRTGYEFTLQLATLLWNGKTDNWTTDDHLAAAAADEGLSFADMQSAIDADPQHYDAAIAANQAELTAAGHWGVPTIVFNGEPFFGHDRIETFLWRAAQGSTP